MRAGCGGGAVQPFTCQLLLPVHRCSKTQMQGRSASRYKSTADCAVQLWRAGGVGAFYKGCLARSELPRLGVMKPESTQCPPSPPFFPVGRVVPGQGIVFMSFESIQAWVETAIAAKP